MKTLRHLTPLALCAVGCCAATREYPKDCAALFPSAAQAMTAAGFEVTVSDATGGVLNAKYAGEPMIYNAFGKGVAPYFEKYVQGGYKKYKLRGLTLTSANFTFTTAGDACKVALTVGLAGVDIKADTDPRHHTGQWVRTYTPVPSNGTAEAEILERVK